MTAVDTMMDVVTREALEEELSRRFPEASIFYGAFTHKFKALVRDAGGTWRELASADPYELADLLDTARTPFPDPLYTSKPLVPSGPAPGGRHARRR